jgi:hypothetical protein
LFTFELIGPRRWSKIQINIFDKRILCPLTVRQMFIVDEQKLVSESIGCLIAWDRRDSCAPFVNSRAKLTLVIIGSVLRFSPCLRASPGSEASALPSTHTNQRHLGETNMRSRQRSNVYEVGHLAELVGHLSSAKGSDSRVLINIRQSRTVAGMQSSIHE